MVDLTIETAGGRVPIMAGATSNNTSEAVREGQGNFVALRASTTSLTATPYYNKPTQEGLYQHYLAIANAVPLPIIVYNVPGRTASNIEPATLLRLARINNIVAVKEASGNISQMAEIAAGVPDGLLRCYPATIPLPSR